MKKPYKNVLTVNESEYKIEVNRSLQSFVVKIGRADMNNYSKKAESFKCDNLRSLKDTLSHLSARNGMSTLNYLCDKKITALDTALMFMNFIEKEITYENNR